MIAEVDIFYAFSHLKDDYFSAIAFETGRNCAPSPYFGGPYQFDGDERHFDGLRLRPDQILRVQQILQLITDRTSQKVLDRYKLGAAKQHLERFLNNAYNPNDELFANSSRIQNVPLGYVHGDFHTGNILTSTNGAEFSYIDFANVPAKPTKHAFIDVGKLSTDLEISVLPNQLLSFDLDGVNRWVAYHRSWLYETSDETIENESIEFKAIYDANSWIRQYLINKHSPHLSRKAILRQFHLVRLHYFLKAIGYFYEEREKIFFLVRASSDILEYLENDQP